MARKNAAAAPATVPQKKAISSAPQDEVTLISPFAIGHYSVSKISQRALGGALTGLGAHFFTGGDVWATAQLGAVIDGTVGAVGGAVSGLGRPSEGAAVGRPNVSAIADAGVGGGVGVLAGGTKGIVIALAGNAFGGGPLAFAGVGALLGALGL